MGPNAKIARRGSWITVVLAALMAPACLSTVTGVSVGHPHLYGEDSVARMMAQRQRGVASLAKGVTADGISERRRLREFTSRDVDSGVGVGVDAPALSELGGVALPDEVPGDLGLPSNTQLRRLITRDQDVLGYELLYLGDDEATSGERELALLRLDISLADTIDLGSDEAFLQLLFEVGLRTSAGSRPSTDVRVLALMPEITSILAEESLTTLALNNVTASLGANIDGVNVGSRNALRRGIEDSLAMLMERPTQFSFLSTFPNQFGVALGPRRTIERRSWVNPRRWIGSNFRPRFVLEPGVRDAYALLSLPRRQSAATHTLTIDAFYMNQPLAPQLLAEVFRTALQPTTSQLRIGDRTPVAGTDTLPFWFGDYRTDLVYFQHIEKALPASSPAQPSADSSLPDFLYPKITSSLLIQTKQPVNAATRAFIDNVRVPDDNHEVLGRFLLRITVPADKGLARKISKQETAELRLHTPGQPLIGPLVLRVRDSDEDKPELFKIAPDSGKPNVTGVTISGLKDVDMTTVSKVMLGAITVPQANFTARAKDMIAFTVPTLPAGTMPDEVAVTVFYADPKKPAEELRAHRTKAFTFK